MRTFIKNQEGFTLIELLIVITIITALAVSVFVALNPSKRLIDARDARRTSDIDTILTAVHESIVDNKGTPPGTMTSGMTEKQLGTAVTGCAISTGGCSVARNTDCIDLSAALNKYLKSIPVDPKSGTAALTNYSVVMDTNGIVTVKACGTGTSTPEGTVNISSSR